MNNSNTVEKDRGRSGEAFNGALYNKCQLYSKSFHLCQSFILLSAPHSNKFSLQ